MPQYTPFWILRYIVLGPRAWVLLIIGLGLLLGLATPLDSSQHPSWVWRDQEWRGVFWLRPSRIGRRLGCLLGVLWSSRWTLLCRIGLMHLLVAGSGLAEDYPALQHWVWLPAADWSLSVVGWLWPRLFANSWYRNLRALTRRAYQWSVLGLGACVVQRGWNLGPTGLLLGSVVVCEREGSRVELERTANADGGTTYRVRLRGEFSFEVTPQDSFAKRLLLLWLRLLRTPGREESPWGIVTQEVLAVVFEVKQEEVSRWQKYWREGRWAQLLSLSDKSLLTDDLRQQIVEVWAANIWQTATQVQQRLAERGVVVAKRLVEEAGRQSGVMRLRAALKEQLVAGPDGVRWRDDYVVRQLFRLVEELLRRVESQGGVPEAVVEVAVLRQLAGVSEPETCLEKPWPWLFQVEHWLFGAWQEVEAGTVRCIYCGSDHVAVKSKKPRRKAYLDEHGQRHMVEVYRYYCKNPDCSYQTFTNLPPGLVVHSVWTLDARLKALELYCGLRTTYRSAAAALGVAPSTLYHWLALFGDEPLQVAALFGVVRSSGVVGIDEKYVKVPKNDKPAGKHRKWMYVYVAVDVHTLDLLHIKVFPHLGKDSVRTFLLELRAKGYQPRAIVTDSSPDYGEPIGEVFPHAVHHECVFHALQMWHRAFKEAFGKEYAETYPAMFKVRQEMDRIFQAKTRRTVEKRYHALLERRERLVRAEPRLEPILDSLVRHYPLLVNAYDHPLIPLTNNATERLIRRLDQHYQNFAGFDSLETAQCYLHLFELTYRLTPFGSEVQPHLRGKCPLELAGYDLSQVPLARYLREHGTRLLFPAPAEIVPK